MSAFSPLCLGFTLTAQAADRQFKKKTVVFKEGQTKTLTLLNSESSPEIMYYEPASSLFSYKVMGTSKIKVTTNRAGIDYITVSNGDTIYYMTFPTDVQFNPDKPKCQRQYMALEKTLNSIQKSFKLKK